jgi:predicted DNA binding CopG/RHH family protein
MISGPFFIGFVVGVGWRPTGFGPRLGHTLGHTSADANVCLMGTRRATLMLVKYFGWDDAKNAKLRAERGIGFEEVVFHIERGHLLDILEHPNPRYAGQRIFVVRREDYAYLVPFVEDEQTVFLKTNHPEPEGHEGSTSARSQRMKLDTDEKELLESVERGEWKSAGGGKRQRTRYSRYAKATFRKDRRLNIRLSSKDLEAIQKRALAEGLPYQTLIASLLHKYAAGRLKEI